MTTTIDTNPAANLTINDPNTADVITVSDGPAENGYQTTQVTTATSTTIFANKSAVVIDGGNNGDKVILDNPDPAAGLQSLTVQNLGTGSTIDGGNPNANSPDIAAPTLDLQAYGSIGVSRALQTQATTLEAFAGLGGAGNVNITNGVSAPTTLNVADLQAVNAGGGTIVLTNNGTINATGPIVATNAVNITANGATADLNTGSGNSLETAPIESNTGSVNVQVGEDINLGDGDADGSVFAATGVLLTAGRKVTLNANAAINQQHFGQHRDNSRRRRHHDANLARQRVR